MRETSSKAGFWRQLDTFSKRTLLYSSTVAAVVALWKMLSPPIMLIIAVWFVAMGAVELIILTKRPAKPVFSMGHFLNGCVLLSITFVFCAQLVLTICGSILSGIVGPAPRTDAVVLLLFGVAAYEWAILTMGAFVRTIIAGSTEAASIVVQPKDS